MILQSCTMFECEVNVVEETVITANVSKIIVAEVGCGATTQNSFHISIVPMDFQVSDKFRGNIFTTTDPRFDPGKHMSWDESNYELTITYTDSSDVFKMEESHQQIRIKYNKIDK